MVVPTTMEEYCMKAKPRNAAQNAVNENIDMDDFYDDDCYDLDDDDDVSVRNFDTFCKPGK